MSEGTAPPMSRILVSLGGNALGTDFDELVESVGVVARPIVGLIRAGHEIVICHGNGPQVGMIKTSIDHGRASFKQPSVPLSEAVAMSQAYVGYHLQNAIENQLHAHGLQKTVCTVISRALVDADDPMFLRPTKPIGAFCTAQEAEGLRRAGKTMVEDSGRGYREVVASPMPTDILEKDAILSLVAAGHVVIAGGGGGIPTVCRDSWYRAVDAVIDKDYTSVMMAAYAGCDALVILTGVEKVAINFNTPRQHDLDELTVAHAERYLAEGQFAEGSMLPKIRAALRFTTSGPGRRTLITSLDRLVEGLAGQTGTWVVP
jgi:carbamate kinase